MSLVLNSLDDLIDELDCSDIIMNLSKYSAIIRSNEEIQELLLKSKFCDKYEFMDIKNRLYKIEDYRKYIDAYNELFYIVMDINYKINDLISDRKCSSASN